MIEARCIGALALAPLVVLAACGRGGGGGGGGPPADLVLLDGTIVTMDDARPLAEALAARDGEIVAVGDDALVRELIGPSTEVLELDGAFVMPGFIEGHGHFVGLGRSLSTVDLTGARSWAEAVARVAERAPEVPPGEWILGWGWHQEKWDEPPEPAVAGYPTHDALSRAVPDHPVLLKHAAGSHAGLVNLAAMERAGIGPDTPDPEGGRILRDAGGRPTGVLLEEAYALALAVEAAGEPDLATPAGRERVRREIALASRECLSKGVTSFQDAGSDFATIDLLREMAEAGELPLRLWVMLRVGNDALAERIEAYRIVGAGDERLTVRAIKAAIDGALGSHGAWLLEPYADWPGHSGLNTTPLAELGRTAELARDHDFQLCVHAIGDRGNRETLDLFEAALAGAPRATERRWRVEHAQHLHPDDVPRFAELGLIASIQGVHCTSDGPWVPTRLGEARAREGAYVWRDLVSAGVRLSNGTDTPVEDVDPVANFAATVTRRTADGSAFYPGQALTRSEALRAATLDAAYAAFEEQRKGSLEPGKLADVVVLTENLLEVPAERIGEARVLYTIVGGRVAWRAGGG